MRVLIAGAAGFIGSHALDHFVESGDDVWVIDKLTYAGDVERIKKHAKVYAGRFLREDIANGHETDRWVNKAHPDVIVNFAAETHVDNSIADARPFVRSNFEGAVNLMTAARERSALYVHVSTDEVYGDATALANLPGFNGFTTRDPLAPRNPYAASKAAADLMVLANANTYGQPFLIFRPSNNFGPRQHEEKFLPKLVKCLVSQPDGGRHDFPLYGDGRQIREWTYAPDTARIVRDAIVSGARDEVLNVSSGVSLENVEVIKLVKSILAEEGKLANPSAVVSVRDRPGHDRRYWIESDVPSGRFTSFGEALRTTVEHYFQRFA